MNRNKQKDGNEEFIKILILGDVGVGKTSLMLRFTENTFAENVPPSLGVDFKARSIEIDGETLNLEIWDTAGQERFRTITSSYYRGAQGIIVVYDVTNETTFGNVKLWLHESERSGIANLKYLIVGNKCDEMKKKLIDETKAINFASSRGIGFIEASAKNSIHIEEIFQTLVKEIISDRSRSDHQASPLSRSKLKLPSSHRRNSSSSSSSSSNNNNIVITSDDGDDYSDNSNSSSCRC